ncbi:hypothetical protein BT96DRAFT_1001521 [Gymnopus androsaceus JB14]|uniref:Heme haloperoxidase family profile domain-containing protein n=1 Tax=Gymnopus androsaceus JB14 TaxID=1447944 RepID=A0A6A4H0T2_9AGAR|nr:hypothetical protein BT96DRAFT_1001521 [Gymnopus androsaceus JB14]
MSRSECCVANHGYIPPSGIVTIDELIQVFGMGTDLALFLGVHGVLLDRNPLSLSFSIGGRPPSACFNQNGLTGSHDNHEADASPTRGDLFGYGDNHDLRMSQFLELYNSASQTHWSITIFPLLASFRVRRFQSSIRSNP